MNESFQLDIIKGASSCQRRREGIQLANIDSIVLNVTKNRDPRAAHTVEVLIFYTLSLSTSMVLADLPITQSKEQRI